MECIVDLCQRNLAFIWLTKDQNYHGFVLGVMGNMKEYPQ